MTTYFYWRDNFRSSLASVARAASFSPLRDKLTDFAARTRRVKCSAAGNVHPPWLAAPLGCPHLLTLAVGGWVVTQVLLRETWEVQFGSQGNPLFSSRIWVCMSICDLQCSSQLQSVLTALHQRQELDFLGEMTLRRTSSTNEFTNDFLPSYFNGGIIHSSCSRSGLLHRLPPAPC